MSRDVLIHLSKQRADIREPKMATFSSPACLRLYPATPDHACLQIRVVGPTTDNGIGKERGMIASANLTLDELRELRAALDAEIARLAPADNEGRAA